ncbi:MAG: M20/M25/M40 family metallo-hydrolase [Candidatus Bathyarchaeota archaeon]|nr:M20/M25/M40 family metallo-hydrolase [Candidatus Bathyarchaeota archaeon]
MDDKKRVQFLTNLLGIYSPSGCEEAISEFIIAKMEKLGFSVKEDSIGNIIGEIGKGELTILLCGHMDTVVAHLPLRIEKGKIYARGAVDAKGPLASMILAAASVVKNPNCNAKLVVASVVEEEATSRGIKNLIKDGISADYAIFGEPSGVGNITIGYKGNLHVKIICKTDTGHSSTPWAFENALEKAFELWGQIKSAFPTDKAPQNPFYSVTACLTQIIGGFANSVIPFKSEMHIDLRIPPKRTSKEILNQTIKVIEKYLSKNPKVKVTYAVEDSNEPFEIDKTSPLVRALSFSIRTINGKPAVLLRKTGTGDMNILGRAINVPIVTYGPGDSHLDHTKDEHIKIRDYLKSIKIYEKAILKLCELHYKIENK